MPGHTGIATKRPHFFGPEFGIQKISPRKTSAFFRSRIRDPLNPNNGRSVFGKWQGMRKMEAHHTAQVRPTPRHSMRQTFFALPPPTRTNPRAFRCTMHPAILLFAPPAAPSAAPSAAPAAAHDCDKEQGRPPRILPFHYLSCRTRPQQLRHHPYPRRAPPSNVPMPSLHCHANALCSCSTRSPARKIHGRIHSVLARSRDEANDCRFPAELRQRDA